MDNTPNLEVTQPISIPNSAPTATPTTQSPIPYRPNSKLPLILMTILFVLALFGAIYFCLQSRKSAPTSDMTKTSSPSPEAIMEDPTEGWQTYTSTEYGFSFKYPNNPELMAIDVNIKDNYSEYVQKGSLGVYEGCGGSKWPDHKIWFIRDNNKSAFDINIWDSDIFQSGEQGFISHDNKTYNISTFRLQGENGDIEPIEQDILDQILSTFKFSNSENLLTKKYVNSKYGYQIEYSGGRLICAGEEDMFYMTVPLNAEDSPEPQNCARDSRFNLELITSNEPFSIDDRYTVITTNFIVAGINANKSIYTRKPDAEGPGESWYEEINFQKGNTYYQGYVRNKELVGTLEKILTTFTFIE